MHSKKAIIIGSGIAGLATAVRLSIQGYEVHVFEKSDQPGGKLGVIEKNGYRFDTGPSLFTQPDNIEELFELAQVPIADYLQYEPVEIACRYFYEGGKTLNAWSDSDQFAEEMNTHFGESPASVKNYLAESEKVYNDIGTVFVNHSLHKRSTWLHKRTAKALKTASFGYLFKTLDQHNRSRLKSSEAVQLFNRYATYNGSNPYKAPGMLSLIPHLEQNLGTFYPKAGMISIVNAVFELAKAKGVHFHFGKAVTSIIHHEQTVKGVVINGNNVYSDIVVSNADIYFTWKNLLHNPYASKKILKQERSSSALIFYWGMNKIFDQLHLHNIFFSNDYKKEFQDLFDQKKLYSDPTIYVNITSKMEEGHAPAGKENWFVMVNAPANTGQDWDKIKQEAKKNIIQKLNRLLQTDIEPLIEAEEILDPLLIEANTGSYMGSLYGTSSNSKLAAFFRHANFSKSIKGLYFCGGSVHPGGGIPLCFKSAKIVGELVQNTDKKNKH